MQHKPHIRRQRQDDSIWPDGNDQSRVVTNKPMKVPHFLCRKEPAGEPPEHKTDAPGLEPHNENDTPAEIRWINGQPVRPDTAPPPRSKNFSPLSPHLHKMMTGRRNEPAAHHETPSWVHETIQENNAAERQGVIKGLAIAGCLVLASGIGLTVTAMEFKSEPSELSATWTSSLAAILPSLNAPPVEIKKLPVVKVLPAPAPDLANAPAPASQAIQSTKITSVKLTVEDANGAVKSPIALPLTAESSQGEPPIAIRLTGLPAQAKLSAGSKQADATWLVQPTDLTDLHLTVPDLPAAPLKVTVAAIESETGELAAPMQEMKITVDRQPVVIVPAALPVTNSQNYSGDAAIKTDYTADKAALAMRVRGDETLALGDVTGARGFYQKALKMGDVASAARIGRTYDPVVYQAVGVHGLKPDPALAERWYKHAISEGDASARKDLKRLTQRSTQ